MKVTVMMVVYNGSEYLRECLESVLSQTFLDFEFLIIDDGSEDDTCDIIESIVDSRIRLIRNAHGYIDSLNLGMREALGQYIARMDTDDIMAPNRLERQVALLDSHPEVAACMSWARAFGELEKDICPRRTGCIRDALPELLEGNFLVHPTAMLRKSFLWEHSLSYKNYPYAEDYKLWADMAKVGGLFWVIPEILLRYRVSMSQVSQTHGQEQGETSLRIQNEILRELLNDEDNGECEGLLSIYKQMEGMNHRGKLSAPAVRHIVYVLYKETKK